SRAIRSRGQAGAALRALLELGAKEVTVLRGGVEARIPTDQLTVGDRFVVRPGEKIATDLREAQEAIGGPHSPVPALSAVVRRLERRAANSPAL
ncbi:hypothetical protein LTR94_037038, partial [Friedmanniomyces endolithicus]